MIKEVEGSVLNPIVEDGVRIILHLINDANAWGDTCCIKISKKWPEIESYYRQEFFRKRSQVFKMGHTIWYFVQPKLAVANIMCQHGKYGQFNPKPLKKKALEAGLDFMIEGAKRIAGDEKALDINRELVTLHAAKEERDWNVIEPIYRRKLQEFDFYLYDSF